MEADKRHTAVCFDSETEQYTGYFNKALVDKMIGQGALELVNESGDELCLLLNSRSDFLSGFASGVNEARLGRDQYYADYNANPFAFSCGYEHFVWISKKPRLLNGYVCHGFVDDATGEIHYQG